MFDAFVWWPTCLGDRTHLIRGSLLAARAKQARLAFSMVQQQRLRYCEHSCFILNKVLIQLLYLLPLYYFI